MALLEESLQGYQELVYSHVDIASEIKELQEEMGQLTLRK
jgi:hypothetical protein